MPQAEVITDTRTLCCFASGFQFCRHRLGHPHLTRARSDGVPVLACLGCRLAETGGPYSVLVCITSLSVCTEVRGIHHTSRKTLKKTLFSPFFASHRRRGALSGCDACNRRRGESCFNRDNGGPRRSERQRWIAMFLPLPVRPSSLASSCACLPCLATMPCLFNPARELLVCLRIKHSGVC